MNNIRARDFCSDWIFNIFINLFVSNAILTVRNTTAMSYYARVEIYICVNCFSEQCDYRRWRCCIRILRSSLWLAGWLSRIISSTKYSCVKLVRVSVYVNVRVIWCTKAMKWLPSWVRVIVISGRDTHYPWLGRFSSLAITQSKETREHMRRREYTLKIYIEGTLFSTCHNIR